MYEDDGPVATTPRDSRADLIDGFFAAEREMAQMEAKRDVLNRERERLAADIEKGRERLAELRKQIGDAFGLTEYAAQKSPGIERMVGDYR